LDKKQRIHVDTNFVIALIDKKDDYHTLAEHSFEKMKENKEMYTLVISQPVLGEVLLKFLKSNNFSSDKNGHVKRIPK